MKKCRLFPLHATCQDCTIHIQTNNNTLFYYIGLNKATTTQEDEADAVNTDDKTSDNVQFAVASQDLTSISSLTKKKKKKGEYPVLNDG